jgi:glucose/arabinose dehydrogenase
MQFPQPGSSQIATEEVLFKDQFGRIRDVIQGPDNFVYFSTSNGNGTDVIVRVKPQ